MKRTIVLLILAMSLLAAFSFVGCDENKDDKGDKGDGTNVEMSQTEIFTEWVKGRDDAINTVDGYTSERTSLVEKTKGSEKENTYITETESRNGEKLYYIYKKFEGSDAASTSKWVDKKYIYRQNDSGMLVFCSIQVRPQGQFDDEENISADDIAGKKVKSPYNYIVKIYTIDESKTYSDFYTAMDNLYAKNGLTGEHSFKANKDGTFSFVMTVNNVSEEYGLKITTETEFVVKDGKLVKINYTEQFESQDESGIEVTVTHDIINFSYNQFNNTLYENIIKGNA